MPITLTSAIVNPNGTRLVVAKVRPDEESSVMTVTLELRTPPASNHIVSTKVVQIRNGLSDRISRAVLAADQTLADWLVFEPNVLDTSLGFTDAMAAWKAGATPSARKSALETHMLASGVIHSSLTGT